MNARQQAQYDMLIKAGASPDAARNAVNLIPTQPTAPTPATPTPQPTPAQPSQSQPESGTPSPSTQANPSLPSTNLQPGSTGQDVSALQDYLVQMGYLKADQVGAGKGTYGPQTTAAVAKLQKDLGLDPSSGAGYYGPQTKQALSQKYQGLFSSLSGSAPDSAGIAKSRIQDALNSQSQTSTDPVFGSLASSIAPIMGALTDILSNISNPTLTATSLQQEYNQLQQQYGLPQMQASLMNMQNVMNGTTDDIRQEITAAGGTATESQVMAMSSARNNVIMKQYNALATQYAAAQTNVQNLMQYASQDQSTQLQKEQMSASIAESMASIETQMQSMAITMNKNTSANLNKIVTNVGYTGLAAQAAGDPQMLAHYEQLLGLSPGALSDPKALSKLETLRQQTVSQGAQRVQIQMYNAGLAGHPTGTNSNTPGLYVNNAGGSGGQSIVATQTQGKDSQGRPYAFTGAQAKALLSSGATIDPGTNNIVVPGIGYYIAQSDGSYRLSLDPNSAEGQFIQYSQRAANPAPWEPSGSLSNQRMTRNAMTRQANAALSQYVNSPTYKNVSAAATYLAKLNAGLQNPGSIGDPDIIDSLVKINTGGQGQITEQQYNAYAQGATWADRFQVVQGKVVAKGGTLSPSQRSEIAKLVGDTLDQYRAQYSSLYVQAMKNLDNQGIPDAFWGNMPDWSQMISGGVVQPQ